MDEEEEEEEEGEGEEEGRRDFIRRREEDEEEDDIWHPRPSTTDEDSEGGEDDDDDVENEMEYSNTMKRCNICLDRFSTYNAIMVARCGHCICSPCMERLFNPDPTYNTRPKSEIPCPFCRTLNRKEEFTKILPTTIQTFTDAERTNIYRRTGRIKKKIEKSIADLQITLKVERERARIISMPAYCTRSMIAKKSAEYLAFLNTRQIEVRLIKSIVDLKGVMFDLDTLKNKITNPDEALFFDCSKQLIKSMVKVMKARQLECPTCSPLYDDDK